MGKKRKSDAARLEEVDRSIYSTFCSAANSLSQLYSQSMHHQRLSFQAGERHAVEKMYNWVLRQEEAGSTVSCSDIIAYIQHEIEYGPEEPPISPRLPFQNQQSQTAAQMANTGLPNYSFGPPVSGHGPRAPHTDHHHAKNVFSNALSSPIRRTLQNYHLAQGNSYTNSVMPPGNDPRNVENANGYSSQHNNRDSNTSCSNDYSMDMHADSPGHESSIDVLNLRIPEEASATMLVLENCVLAKSGAF